MQTMNVCLVGCDSAAIGFYLIVTTFSLCFLFFGTTINTPKYRGFVALLSSIERIITSKYKTVKYLTVGHDNKFIDA
jgi:hypothetical protein